ncbi:MAG: hypothetical protein M9944_12860 [Rhizobiaceae bacterium]|nr:hypothetical protein [Rhizobiaceae bacterium]
MTYEEDLVGVSEQAICEAAVRFRRGLVDGQSRTFAPSIAEFCIEARKIADILPFRDRPSIPPPRKDAFRHDDRKTRIRMGFKMTLLSTAIGLRKVDEVDKANKRGLDDLIALAQQWGVPVPDELWQNSGVA